MLDRLFLAACALACAGCAVKPTRITLDAPPAQSAAAFPVIDARLDRQLSMTAIAFGGAVTVVQIDPEPSLVASLEAHLKAARPTALAASSAYKLSLEDVVIRNRVGFGTADDLTCLMQSKVTASSAAGSRDTVVRTTTNNKTNLSSFIDTAATVVTKQCIREHSEQVWAAILALGSP